MWFFIAENANFAKGSANAIKVDGTLKVTGTLDTSVTGVTGDGTIELANATDATTNGSNLVNASKSGIKNVKVSSNADTVNSVVVNDKVKELNVNIGSEATVDFKTSKAPAFHVENGGTLNITGDKDNPGTIKVDEQTTALQNLDSTLKVSDVNVEGRTGVYVMSEGSKTTLENVTIKAKLYGLTSNEAESDKGIGNVTLKDCNISAVDNAGLYLPARGTVTINGGTITGWSAILTKGANLDLKGVTLKSEGNRYTDALSGHNNGSYMAAADGAVLLIISQGTYAENETVKINIDDDVVFEQNCTKSSFEGTKNYLIEVVGTKTATSTDVAGNLEIKYSKFDTAENSNIDTTAPSGNTVDSLKDIKAYLVDIATECKTSIKLNNKEYNQNVES